MIRLMSTSAALLCAVLVLAGGRWCLGSEVDLTPLSVLPGDDAIDRAASRQETPVIAAGDGGSLAVWTDSRTNFLLAPPPNFEMLPVFDEQQSARDIYAARLDENGVVLDTTPIIVSQASGYQREPQVAWNGEHWLVVWESQVLIGHSGATNISAARVTTDGIVLDDPPITVLQEQFTTFGLHDVASDGENWLIAAQAQTGDGIQSVRISSQGAVLDPGGATLAPDESFSYANIMLASADGEYLMTYKASSQFQGRRFSGDLSPLGGPFNLPGVHVASNGDEYFLVWSSGNSLRGSRMTLDGTLLDPSGVVIAPQAALVVPEEIDVTWDGITWWASWRTAGAGIRAARIDAGGNVLDSGGVALDASLAEHMDEHAIAGISKGGIQVVWRDDRAETLYPSDIFTSSYSADAVPDNSSVAVSLAAPSQLASNVALGGDGALLVYRSETSDSHRTMAQRLDVDGKPIDSPVELGDGVDMHDPAVAWDGSRFMIVWTDDSNTIVGRRMLPDGTLLDAAPFPIMPGTQADVAALGTTFLVVGTHVPVSIHFRVPYSRRVDGNTGALLDAEPVALGQYFARFPAVTTFDGRWLATWQRHPSHDNPQSFIHAAFIEPDGTTDGSIAVSGQLHNGREVVVAASPDIALLVWRSHSTHSADNDIKARFMSPDGSFPDDVFLISEANDKQTAPSVAWDGSQFVAAWEDRRNSDAFFDERTDIFAARISEDGEIIDVDGVPVATDSVPEKDVALAAAGGRTWISASVFQPGPPWSSYRIGVGWLEESELTADLNGDGIVGAADLLMLLAAWGTPDGDLDDDGDTGVNDLLILLSAWSD